MKQYYYSNDKEVQKGPFTFDELLKENIKKNTLIWHADMTDWQKAEDIEELRNYFLTPPPIDKTPPPLNIDIPKDKSSQIKSKKELQTIIYVLIGAGVFLLIVFLLSYFNASKHDAVEKAKIETVNDIENQMLQIEEEKKNAEEKNKKKIRNNFFNYIIASRSTFMYKEIGGISDLYITITNNTDYKLDNVEVLVSYIKTNGQVYKNETIQFNNISSQSWQKLKAPNSDRGTGVEYTIISIISTELNFCYAEGNWAANSNDPYKCN